MPDEEKLAESVEKRARMLDLQAAVVPPVVVGRQARYTFVVSRETAEAHMEDWSEPVRFQFREGADGRLELWMTTVERSSDGA